MASGKPPLKVNSTTKVANLNADRLDDKDSTELAPILRAQQDGSVDGQQVTGTTEVKSASIRICRWGSTISPPRDRQRLRADGNPLSDSIPRSTARTPTQLGGERTTPRTQEAVAHQARVLRSAIP